MSTGNTNLNQVNLAIRTQQPQRDSRPKSVSGAFDRVKEAWIKRCASLTKEEKELFESAACDGLEMYLKTIEDALEDRKESTGLKILDWFEPFYKVVQMITPATAVAAQAIPNPGSLVLGGIAGILTMTKQVYEYQRLLLRMVEKMGSKAQILLEYETNLYEDEPLVQEALMKVVSDIVEFCQKAFRFLTQNKQLTIRITGLKCSMFRDFDSHLGREVHNFERHLERLQDLASSCDKRRLKEIRESQDAHHNRFTGVLKELRESQETQYIQFAGAQMENREQFDRQNDAILHMMKRQEDVRKHAEQRDLEDKKRILLQWLSPVDFEPTYDRRCREHLEGTGTWLTESEKYQTWLSSPDPDLLWINGKPGCGKSVLAAVAILNLYLRSEQGEALAYAFCQRGDESSETSGAVLCALARQISQKQTSISPTLMDEYTASAQGQPPSGPAVRRILNSTLNSFNKTFLVIDALDECKESEQLAKELLDLLQDRGIPPLKIIVFSRRNFELEGPFKSYNYLESDRENEGDLKAYIYDCFPDEPDPTVNQKAQKVNQEIHEECFAKADGMFLWVNLVEKSLRGPLNGKMKLDRIKKIRPKLESIYDTILDDIWAKAPDVKATAILVLLWITHAKRPLLSSEMLEAVADLSEAIKFEDVFPYQNPDDLVALCANLVFIDKSGRFRLCHESAREYLDQAGPTLGQPLLEYQEERKNAHKLLAEICIKYLLLKDFDCGPAKSVGGLIALLNKYPFLEYAAQFWGWHISNSENLLPQDLVLQAITTSTRRELSIQITLYDPEDDSTFWNFSGSSNALHLICLFGLGELAEGVPNTIASLQEEDGAGATPLFYALIERQYSTTLWAINVIRDAAGIQVDAQENVIAIHVAAGHGWTDVLDVLLSKDDASVDARMGKEGLTPLCRACSAGQKDTAAILIRHGAKVDLKAKTGDTPLIIATLNGRLELVNLLLENGADPNRPDANGVRPLHVAADNGYALIAAALLNKNANPLEEVLDADRQTALHLAAANQSLEVIRVLCKMNSKIDQKSEQGYTALHMASWFNMSESAKILLELGAPREEKDELGRTALFIAIEQGALETVRVLIENGCSVSSTAKDRRTVFHAAASSGKISIMRRVLLAQPMENSGLINERSEEQKTPLHEAIGAGNAEVVRLLLDSGADPTINGFLNSSPLHYAAHYGHKTMLGLLLSRTKNPNPRNEDEDTPLHFAARANRFGFVKLIFQECSQLGLSIDTEARNRRKKTALAVALAEGHHNIAKILMKKTKLISDPDADGNFLIHYAAWNGYDSIVRTLAAYEGVSQKGYNGRTPLLCAAIRGHLNAAKVLADTSLGLMEISDDGQGTPVLTALSCRQLEVANYLLDQGADHQVQDEYDNTLLHIAARINDLPMVQRLLKLGCKPDSLNWFKQTPFHNAVQADSIEIVDAFLAEGFNAVHIPDGLGNLCVHIAAEKGSLKMLEKLDSLGTQYGVCDLLGRTPAFSAANYGHYEVLEFLQNRGERLDGTDYEGFTALMIAAGCGYPDTVKYLLQRQKHMVNAGQWDGDTAILLAARKSAPLTIRQLLRAGADPHQRNILGQDAFDCANSHRPSLREFHKAGYWRRQERSDTNRKLLVEAICRCCDDLIADPLELPVKQAYRRIFHTMDLAVALLQTKDWDSAKPCLMEIYWPPKFGFIGANWRCGICAAKNFDGDKYICKSCPSLVELCPNCHKEYVSIGEAPDALQELEVLEGVVQPVRSAAYGSLTLLGVTGAMTYFETAISWLSSVLDLYEAWEHKYNARARFRELERPGQEFLKMVKAVDVLTDKIAAEGEATSEDSKQLSDLEKQYEEFQKKHKADKEWMPFACKGHEYLLLSADDRKEAKLAGEDIDSAQGKATQSFLEKLRDKYRQVRMGVSENSHAWTPPPWKGAKAPSPMDSSEQTTRPKKADRSMELPPRPPKRSYTMASLKPAIQPKDDNVLSSQPVRTVKIAPGLSSEEDQPRPPRRAQTMPIKLTQTPDFRGDEIEVEMKDMRLITEIQNQLKSMEEPRPLKLDPEALEPQMTTRKVSVAFVDEPDEIPNSSENAGPGHSANADTSPKANPTESSAPRTAMDDSSDSDGGQGLDIARLAYMMVHDSSPTTEQVILWAAALNITDAMIPGFSNGYFARKRAQREAMDALRRGLEMADEDETENPEDEDEDEGDLEDDDDEDETL